MYDSVTLMYNESLQQKKKSPSCGKLQGDTRRQRRWKLCPSAALDAKLVRATRPTNARPATATATHARKGFSLT
jgi:hypothetical protein